MASIDDRITIIKAVRANLGISLTQGKDIVDAAYRAGLGTYTATQRHIEEAVADLVSGGKVSDVTALLLRLVPTPDDQHGESAVWVNPTDVAQRAVQAWLDAAGADDSTVIPYPNGKPGSTLTISDLRRSQRAAAFAG
ncbi:hypothetical protein [Curtobacterium sp. MCPF17_031]|uniref:hypothetical protein n=1 Tax=Curtobacterium sp. MCPF17_031 TaxID=2175653 RepID=UPI000DA7649E|nr:hypothetical protein [Curtobacterium sp. MCPF17_031]PZE33925.1 hypothetical protein DEJ31_15915 [Curtobacterium sp. MCPF17_031]